MQCGLRFLDLYQCTMVQSNAVVDTSKLIVQRVQTGVRLEKRLLKVLKAFAEYKDMTLGDLLEGIVLHAFDGKAPFSEESRRRIADLKRFYGLDLDSSASHRLEESRRRKSHRAGKQQRAKGNSGTRRKAR
jgi:hypothetical protein